MYFYSNSKPDLVLPSIKKTVFKIVNKPVVNNTLSDKIVNMAGGFYQKYVGDNTIVVIIVLAVVVLLLWRYYQGKNSSNETFDDLKLMQELDSQTDHLKYDTQPSFNNLQSVNSQAQKVNYIVDPVPPLNTGQGLVYDNALYPYSQPNENLNNPNYNYSDVYANPASYYSGTLNTYSKAQDTNITNPLGFSNDFNGTTGSFVTGMTKANEQNIVDYQQVMDNMNEQLTTSIGPDGLNLTDYEPTMIAPYAQ